MKKKIAVYIGEIGGANLKVINDSYGHASGDVALKALSNIISDIIDEEECAARIGGDEFSAIIIIKDINSTSSFKERLQKGIDEYNANSGECNLEASVGICELHENESATLFDCMKIADMRMYEDKRAKKNYRRTIY